MDSRLFKILLLNVLIVLYFGSLGSVSLTDPDEVFYSLTAKEMLDAKSILTPVIFHQPQFEKPPLFYWALQGSFKMWGLSAQSARLIPALCGFFCVILTFLFCRRVFNERIAYIASIILSTSALYLALAHAVLTDIMLAAFVTAAFYAFYLWFLERQPSYLYGYALAAAFAVLTKGPIAFTILLIACVLFLIILREFKLLREFLVHPWVLVFCLVSIPWYAVMVGKYGQAFINEFFIHDNWHRILYAEHPHSDRWYFYPMIMMAGLFPWTFYLVMMGAGWKEYKKECLFLLVWVAVTFLIFQKAHSKLASYILPLIPAWVILLSISINALSEGLKRVFALVVIYVILGGVCIMAPSVIIHKFPEYMWPNAITALRLFALALIGSTVFLGRGDALRAVIIKAVGFALMFVLMGVSIPSGIDRAIADEYLQHIVKEQDYQGQPIVTNKLYSRGIYFYTGNPVVVMDHNKQPFWSPHPIEVISTESEISAFFKDRPRVICVLKKSYVEELNRIFKNQRINHEIARDGQKIVIVSEQI